MEEKIETITTVALKIDGDSSPKARRQRVWRALTEASKCETCGYIVKAKPGTCPESECGGKTKSMTFPGAYKPGPGTANWIIPANEARAWLEGQGD